MDKKKIILIVEDDAVTRILLDAELKKAGYDVYQASDGEKGFLQIQEVRPHLVICDVVMPKMDGNQLFKKLRKSDFGYKIPFIILTAHGAMEDYFEIMGVDDFIVKPFKSEELLARIEAVFNKSEASFESQNTSGRMSPDDVAKTIVYGEAIDQGKNVGGNYESDPGMQLPGGIQGTSKELFAKRKKKILVAENNIMIFGELQRIFSQYGYDTMVAQNLERCLELAKQAPGPDLIILKYYLNGKNTELFANVLKTMPQFEYIPIVIYDDIQEKSNKKRPWERGIKNFQLSEEGERLVKRVQELLKE